MAKKEFVPQFDETKQYKLLSKEILIPFIALSFLAIAPIIQQTSSGVYNNVMMAALGAAKVADLNTVINSVFRASAALVWGGLFDKYNKKTIVVILTLCQLAAGTIIGFAPNLYVLLFATLIGAIGSGGATSGLTALLGYMLPAKYRGTFQGWRSLLNVGVTFMTPYIAKVLTVFGWRYCLIFNVSAYIICLLGSIFLLPSMPVTGPVNIKKFDSIGCALFLSGTIVFFSASYLGGTFVPWSSPILWLLFAVSMVIYFFAIRYEKNHEDIALFSVSLFKNKKFVQAVIIGCGFFAFWQAATYKQLFLVQGIGLALVTYSTIGTVARQVSNIVGIVYPIILDRTQKFKLVSLVIIWVHFIATVALTFLNKGSSESQIYWTLLFGDILPISLGQLLVINALDTKDLSRGSGTYTFVFYYFVGVFGLLYNVIYNNVFAAVVKSNMAGFMSQLSADQIKSMSDYKVVTTAKLLEAFQKTFNGNTDLFNQAVAAVRGAVTTGARTCYYVGLVFVAIAGITAFFIPNEYKGKKKS